MGASVLRGKVCIVTGANGGIGKVVATKLAEAGGRVILACRNRGSALAARDELRDSTGGDVEVSQVDLDLTSLSSVRSFAAQFSGQPVHCLVNNAGVMCGEHEVTRDGYEVTFQTNALSPLLLTSLLKDSLAMASPGPAGTPGAGWSSVVYVGSRLEKRGDLGDLESVPDPRRRFLSSAGAFSTFPAYGTSKLAGQVLFYEVARRWGVEGHAVAVNCCTPGMVNTGLGRFAPSWQQWLSWPLRALLLRSPEKGAETPVFLCTSAPPTASGRYFSDCAEIRSSPASYDEARAKQLWATCEAMVGGTLA